jgi:UTP--glucose-1-phosphate uridylyltransferase
MANRKVSKVVIPVAGMGTRFLPATKALPKELLPIVDRPIIHYIVQEAVNAGIETVVFITSRPKILIEDYFDPGDLTSMKLAQADKLGLIDQVLELSKKIDIISIRQYEPRGLGHAILQAAPVVEGQPFSVVLGDDIVTSQSGSAIGDCIKTFGELDQGSVVGVVEVPKSQTNMYGIVDYGPKGPDKGPYSKVHAFVEKPDPAKAPSNWALPGRYVFESEIIDTLRDTKPGKNNEIQLTDAMDTLRKTRPFYARKIDGERYDTGDRLGYIIANVSFALDNPKYREDLRDWLRKKIAD